VDALADQPVETISPYGEHQWMLNGQLHRVDGPAWIDRNGGETQISEHMRDRSVSYTTWTRI
jgi:hypothetical protein